MATPPNPTFSATKLPWLLALAGLVLFLATLNHWVTLASLGLVAKITGWDWWTPTLQAPVLLILTYPIRWLPPGAQPLAMNLFTALCAAATLGILARSVALLPHDRTKEQRWLNRDSRGLLITRWAWAPVLLAALACGLEQTFWEHATAATGEMLDLLLFAALVWCLLEHRLSRNDRWLHAFAFLTAIAVTNNWAMLGFLPFFAVALVWIKGMALFNRALLLRMALLAALGLSLYVVLPWVASRGPDAPAGFWQSLRMELGAQKNLLLQYPKGRALLLSLTALLPLFMMGIRWSASLGDSNALSNRITTLMFYIVHTVFLVACTAVAFNPVFSPRALGYGLPFLPFYYLGALSIGYFSGYLLLVFGEEKPNAWERPKGIFKLAQAAIVGVVLAASLGVPAALFLRNLPSIQSENGPALRRFAGQLAQSVPPEKTIVLADDASWLVLMAAGNPALASQNLLVDKRSFGMPVYHQMLQRRAPALWPDLFGGKLPTNSLPQSVQNQILTRLAVTNALYHLHATPGSQLFETLQSRPNGLASRLIPYPAPAAASATNAAGAPTPARDKLTSKMQETVLAPPLTAPEVAFNEDFWKRADESLGRPTAKVAASRSQAIIAASYSQGLNSWGVELQRAGRLAEAEKHFTRALGINPDNAVAAVNLVVNRKLRGGREKPVAADAATDQKFARQRTWALILSAHGPIDEPRYCTQIGEAFAKAGLLRQAAQQLLRAQTLDPEAFDPRAGLAEVFTQARLPDLALELIRETRTASAPALLVSTNQVTLTCAEAVALYHKTNFAAADQLLADALEKFPRDPRVPATLTKLNIVSRRFTNALVSVERELSLTPNNQRALLNKGAILVELKQYAQALVPLDTLLRSRPDHAPALLNRSIAHLNLNHLDLAQRDCESLRRLEPNLNSAPIGLAEIALRRQRTNDAIKHFETARQLSAPGSPEFRSLDKRIGELQKTPR